MIDDAVGDADGTIDIDSLKNRRLGTYTHTYTQRDAMLYALGLGCTAASDLRYVYEGADDFAVLPTYGIVAAHPSLALVPLESYLPGGLDRTAALHGEQYLELLGPPLPPGGSRLVTRPQLVDMQTKGSGLVVVLRTVTTDLESGRDVAINEFTTFVLGKGGIRTPWPPAPRTPAAVASNDPPNRPPDATATFTTSPDQAALYRLSGDFNPLHIDPQVSGRLGFPQPILHGLCTLGVSVRLVMKAFGGDDSARLRSVKVRFSKHVLPGETLRVEMWALSEPQTSTSPAAALSARPHQHQHQHQHQQARDGDGDTSSAATNAAADVSATITTATTAPAAGGILKVIFRTLVVERKAVAISNAAVELLLPPEPISTPIPTTMTAQQPVHMARAPAAPPSRL